jgi:hypothetical protein
MMLKPILARLICCLLLVGLSPLVSAESRSHQVESAAPVSLIEGLQEIDWQATPASLRAQPSNATVIWVGQVKAIRAGTHTLQTKANGQTIKVPSAEFICTWHPLAGVGPQALQTPVRVGPATNEVFVVALNSVGLTPSRIRSMQRDLSRKPHYAIITGKLVSFGQMDGQPVTFIKMGRSLIGDARDVPLEIVASR